MALHSSLTPTLSQRERGNDEIPREVLRFAQDKLGMTMMVRLASHSGYE